MTRVNELYLKGMLGKGNIKLSEDKKGRVVVCLLIEIMVDL